MAGKLLKLQQPHSSSETRPELNGPRVPIVQHSQYDSELRLDSLLSFDFLHLRRSTFNANIARTSTTIHTTIQPSTQHQRNQNSPPPFTQHHLHLHFQHGQVKERPQDPNYLLRQSQNERLRPPHHQPPVQRARHRSSRLHGRQSLRYWPFQRHPLC